MKKFKKFTLLLCLILTLALILTSCKNGDEAKEEKKVKIVTTIFPEYDFVRQLTDGVKDVEVKNLTPFGVDVHCFEPTPKNIIEVKESNLFVYVGGETEAWVKKILNSSEKDENSSISLLETLNFKDSEKKDEHVWTSLLNCMKIVEKLKEKLCEINPENKNLYEENCENYLKELKGLHEEFKEVVLNKKRDLLVFADRFAFSHFVKDYGLKYVSPYFGCSSEEEASSKKIAEIVKIVKENKIPVILKLEQGNSSVAKEIAKETGAVVKNFNSCHNCTEEEFKKGETFLGLFKRNLKTLKEAVGLLWI